MRSHTKSLVFIVEDNELYSTMLNYVLSQDIPCHFVCFTSGEECIRSLHLDPLLVILDYELPGMNGLQTLERIKKVNSSVPVVILTWYEDPKVIRSLLNAGADDYLIKNRSEVREISDMINELLCPPGLRTSPGIRQGSENKIKRP